MPQTPLSSTSSYCTAAQFTARVDWRTVADYLSDDGTRLPDQDAVEASPILAKLLKSASGDLEAAVLVGERYVPDDLRAIADAATPTNGTEMLAEIVAGLALPKIFRRRPDRNPGTFELAAEAQARIEQLRKGERILPTVESADAGLPEAQVETARQVENRQGLTYQMREFFGRRADRNDPTRQ